jgi:hypothetical protein
MYHPSPSFPLASLSDIPSYSKTPQKTPLLPESFPEEKAIEQDQTNMKDLGKASGLLFIKNLCSTAAAVVGSVMLAGVLDQNQFLANTILQNTIQVRKGRRKREQNSKTPFETPNFGDAKTSHSKISTEHFKIRMCVVPIY